MAEGGEGTRRREKSRRFLGIQQRGDGRMQWWWNAWSARSPLSRTRSVTGFSYEATARAETMEKVEAREEGEVYRSRLQ